MRQRAFAKHGTVATIRSSQRLSPADKHMNSGGIVLSGLSLQTFVTAPQLKRNCLCMQLLLIHLLGLGSILCVKAFPVCQLAQELQLDSFRPEWNRA